MEYYCFINCKSLTTLTFPKTFRSIGFDCFNGCSNLKTVNFKAAAPFPIDWLLAKTKATAYVPKVSLEAYQGNTSNVNYKDRIKALVTTAGD